MILAASLSESSRFFSHDDVPHDVQMNESTTYPSWQFVRPCVLQFIQESFVSLTYLFMPGS